MKKINAVLGLLILGLTLSSCTLVEKPSTDSEKFIATLPDGFTVGFHNARNGLTTTEMIPKNENLNNWSEMHTVQTLHNIQVPLTTLLTKLKAGMDSKCEGINDLTITPGILNGYSYATLDVYCFKEKRTGRGSFTKIHAFQGQKQRMYVYHMAVRGAPFKQIDQQNVITRDKLNSWHYVPRGVIFCDTQDADHPCPAFVTAAQ